MDRDEDPQKQEISSEQVESDLDLAFRLSLETQREEQELARVLQLSAQSSQPAGGDGSSSPIPTVGAIPRPDPRRQAATFEPRICDDCGEIKVEGQFGFEDCQYSAEWYCLDCWQSWQPRCVSFTNQPAAAAAEAGAAAATPAAAAAAEAGAAAAATPTPTATAAAAPPPAPAPAPAPPAAAQAAAAAAQAAAAAASPEEVGSDQQQQQPEPVQDPPMNSPEGASSAAHLVPLCEAKDATADEPGPREAADFQHVGMQEIPPCNTEDAIAAELQPRRAADPQRARMQQIHSRFQRWFQQQQARAGVSLLPAARHEWQAYLSPVQVMLMSVNRAEAHETANVDPELPQLPELDFDIDDLYEESEVAAAIASAVLSQFASVNPALQAAQSPVSHPGASSSATGVESSGDDPFSDEQRRLEQAERDALIAASLQRQQLLAQQEEEYAESLRVDQEKEAARRREAEFEQQRQEMLRQQAERHAQHQLEEENRRRQERQERREERQEENRRRRERRPQPRREEVNHRSQSSSAAGDCAAAPKEFKASAEPSKNESSEELLSEADRRARQREMRLRAAEARMHGPSWITSSLPNSGAPSLAEVAAAASSSSQQQCRQQQQSDATTQQDSAAPGQSTSGHSPAASGDKNKHVDSDTREHQAATDQAAPAAPSAPPATATGDTQALNLLSLFISECSQPDFQIKVTSVFKYKPQRKWMSMNLLVGNALVKAGAAAGMGDACELKTLKSVVQAAGSNQSVLLKVQEAEGVLKMQGRNVFDMKEDEYLAVGAQSPEPAPAPTPAPAASPVAAAPPIEASHVSHQSFQGPGQDAAGNDGDFDFLNHMPSVEEILGELDAHLQGDLADSGTAGYNDDSTSSAAATAAADGVHLADAESAQAASASSKDLWQRSQKSQDSSQSKIPPGRFRRSTSEAVASTETRGFTAAEACDRPAAAKTYDRPESVKDEHHPAAAKPYGRPESVKDELMKKSVSELRSELAQQGMSTKGCIEKADIVERLFSAMQARGGTVIAGVDVAASAEAASANVAHTAAAPAKTELSPEAEESETSEQDDLQDLYSTDWSKLFSADAAPFDARHCDPCDEAEQGAAKDTAQAEAAQIAAEQDENHIDELARLREVLRRQEEELLNARRLEKELENARALLRERDREVSMLVKQQMVQPDGAGSTSTGSSTDISAGRSSGSSTGSL